MLLARRGDFEPSPQEGAQALYYDPADGAGYRDFAFFQDRVDGMRGRFAPTGQRLLVAGCGFGYLVARAVAAGYNAFGVDASQYAIDRGKALLPAIASRLFVGDCLNDAQMRSVANAAGIPGGNPRWPLLVTEDLLTCLSDAEIPQALSVLRARSTANLLHIVWLKDTSAAQDPRVNWKTRDEWRAVCCPPDVVGCCEPGTGALRFWNAVGEV